MPAQFVWHDHLEYVVARYLNSGSGPSDV